MKKFFSFLSILAIIPLFCIAKEKQYPDPFYLSSPPKEYVAPKVYEKDIPIDNFEKKVKTEAENSEDNSEQAEELNSQDEIETKNQSQNSVDDAEMINSNNDSQEFTSESENTDVSDENAEAIENNESSAIDDEVIQIPDNRTLKEKLRKKLHLPPTKKIYYHNIDKSMQPMTQAEYEYMAEDVKREDRVIPEPKFESDPKIMMPDSHYRVVSYNSPPGQRNIDISRIMAEKTAISPGILSPDKTKMVYTKCFYYSKFNQTTSAAYYIPVTETSDAYKALFYTSSVHQDPNPIVMVGMDKLVQAKFSTLFPLDWSKDSMKIAFKEKIGSNLSGTWVTNVIVYDFKTKSWKRLTAVREAIIYWYRKNKNIELKDYMWDIAPIGWDKNNPNKIIVFAYVYKNNQPKPEFLGSWSVDYNEEKSELISTDSAEAEIDLNGFGFKHIIRN